MSDWRTDGPDWKDGGAIELLQDDGTVLAGDLILDEWFTGEDEIPVGTVTLKDGRQVSTWDFKGWRCVTRN